MNMEMPKNEEEGLPGGSQSWTGQEAMKKTFEHKFEGKISELLKAEEELKELRGKFEKTEVGDSVSFKEFTSSEGLTHFDDFKNAPHDLIQDYIITGKNSENLTLTVEGSIEKDGTPEKVTKTISIYELIDSFR